MNLPTPAQNYDHLLVTVSGYSGMHDLQKRGNASELNGIIYKGSLVSIDPADGLVKAGLVSKHAMAMFAINGSRDFDVSGDVGNVATVDSVVGSYPATCGMELATTEFDIASRAQLKPNSLLAPHATHMGWVDAAAARYSDNAVVGVVSDGVRTETYGQYVLAFWPVYCPAVNSAVLGSSSN